MEVSTPWRYRLGLSRVSLNLNRLEAGTAWREIRLGERRPLESGEQSGERGASVVRAAEQLMSRTISVPITTTGCPGPPPAKRLPAAVLGAQLAIFLDEEKRERGLASIASACREVHGTSGATRGHSACRLAAERRGKRCEASSALRWPGESDDWACGNAEEILILFITLL